LALGVGPTLDVGVDNSGHYRAWQARPQFEGRSWFVSASLGNKLTDGFPPRSGRSDKDAIPSLLATTRDTCFVTSGVIAGAGSGKTNTLAHRVAHLIVEGADQRRILPW